jgi:hypothetical protein
MSVHNSITINCWVPDGQSIAIGLLLAGIPLGGLGAMFFETTRLFSPATQVGIVGSFLLLGYWCTYCRVRITPWEVRVLGSGVWKGRYCCPLEEAAIGTYWVLPELAAQANYYSAALSFSPEEDWDTGTPYLEIQWYGEDVFNSFRVKQFAEISSALETMKNRRIALEGRGVDQQYHA